MTKESSNEAEPVKATIASFEAVKEAALRLPTVRDASRQVAERVEELSEQIEHLVEDEVKSLIDELEELL